jgi:hypothetical protein
MGRIRVNARREGVGRIVSKTGRSALDITLACVNTKREGPKRFKGVGDNVFEVTSSVVRARARGEGVGWSQP